ncbi:uncharacterized protein KGF55_003103 [Candida pseudojiufengensis]|uniref:uncharacterized protein n=1 Tax=Candida pseudojiufengensis TaxID=497109 RepID=UPI0022256DCA|nr:uncharacterized protein KGF55_003103 [Candida pseudojiufengensis]KAI5963311.1 hypothetical protein KGF55_003103 [Candida pseudojiufengensis]
MSDFAFNNYCIQCDQLCPTNSVYCSETCKNQEIQSSILELKKQKESISYNHNHSSTSTSESSTNSSTELVSPLLTPALYLQQQQQLYNNSQLSISSPLLLSQSNEDEDFSSSNDLNYFDLNYSINSNINYTTNNDQTSNKNSNEELINSTSHNYRKWLTAL